MNGLLQRIIFSIGLLTATAQAQQPHYSMEVFGSKEGLLFPKIYSLYQSADRHLWIGTEFGISSYNGYEFENFQYTDRHEPIGRILSITEDSLHGIWLGGDKGLFRMKDGTIKKTVVLPGVNPAVEALHTDTRGNIWIGDLNGFFKLDTKTINAIASKGNTGVVAANFSGIKMRVFGIAEDRNGNIYFSSFDGVFKISPHAKNPVTVWTNPEPVQFVRSVAALSEDSIYLNRLDDHPIGLIRNKAQTTYSPRFVGYRVFTHQQIPYCLTTSGIAQIGQTLEPVVSFGNRINNATCAIIDQEGNYWIGTWEGLLKFRKIYFQQHDLPHPTQKEFFSLTQLTNGQTIIGSNRGLLFGLQNNELTAHTGIPPLFTKAEVKCLYDDGAGGLWAGSGYQGVSRYKNNRVQNWLHQGMLKDNNCEELFPAEDGKIFACTENGVTLINPRLPNPMEAHYAYALPYIRPPELYGCLKTVIGKYWFYGNHGLFSLKQQQLFPDSIEGIPFRDIYINKIIHDRSGNIWIATQASGLLQCRQQNGKLSLIKQYKKENGLASDIALSVVCDDRNNIWTGDYNSLCAILQPGSQERIAIFNEKDGLLSSYYEKLKLEKLKDGRIWGLTSMGAFSFHPDSIETNTLELLPVIQQVSYTNAGGKDITPQGSAFAYNENSIRIRFTAVSLTEPSKTWYTYRIPELDTNWIYTQERSVSFNFLPPGKYSFQLKAGNNSNIWSSQATGYSFIIRPPFWQTWWFRAALMLGIALLAYALFRRRLTAIKNKAKIQQQVAELESKALRAQMNPHFIFNSLNAIQELILTEKVEKAYQYLSSFSRLLRMVLNHSEKNLIPLSSELEMIRLQLSLESLRFKNAFNYSIEIDDSADPDMINIPPLLLQPYVENAVWHGLGPKEGEKILTLSIREDHGKVAIEITDNGVGRQKAAAIKNQKLGAYNYESRGSSLSEQRIKILNEQYPGSAQVSTEDIFTDKQEPAGTKIKISIAANLYKP